MGSTNRDDEKVVHLVHLIFTATKWSFKGERAAAGQKTAKTTTPRHGTNTTNALYQYDHRRVEVHRPCTREQKEEEGGTVENAEKCILPSIHSFDRSDEASSAGAGERSRRRLRTRERMTKKKIRHFWKFLRRI